MKLVILAIVTGGLLGALVAYLWCSSPAYTRAIDDPGTVAMLTFGEFGDPVVVDNVLRFWEETRPPTRGRQTYNWLGQRLRRAGERWKGLWSGMERGG